MLAIHNCLSLFRKFVRVANAFAKLSKCQQFTTTVRPINIASQLQTLMQSYQNVSNSQLLNVSKSANSCCKRLCKVIKMLAIHNFIKSFKVLSFVANAYAKLSKCQQFTTERYFSISIPQLQTLMQSYQNVSNSQRRRHSPSPAGCCKRFCKVIKMLAIHNQIRTIKRTIEVANAYAKLSKCQQFTTCSQSLAFLSLLQTLMQSYQNVSNSQQT